MTESCMSCVGFSRGSDEEPCRSCRNNYTDNYEESGDYKRGYTAGVAAVLHKLETVKLIDRGQGIEVNLAECLKGVMYGEG